MTRKPPETPLRILMIGPMPSQAVMYSGPEACVEQIIGLLKKHDDVTVMTVSTTRPPHNGFLRFLSAAGSLGQILLKIGFCDIIFLLVTNVSLYSILRVLNPLARLFGKPLIVKKFGGRAHSDDYHILYPPTPFPEKTAKRITEELKKTTLYMPETRHAYEKAVKDGIRSLWLPNFRVLPKDAPETASTKEKRGDRFQFAFVARVTAQKGVAEIIAADKMLNDGIEVDIYGPFDDRNQDDALSERSFAGLRHVRYCGVLKNEDVLPTLKKYDAYVFPSYYPNEGHPGSLIEAFSVGLPTVTTDWPFINEVADETNAIMIKPKNVEALAEAMNRLASDEELQRRLSENARVRSRFFDAGHWGDILINICRHPAIPQTVYTGSG